MKTPHAVDLCHSCAAYFYALVLPIYESVIGRLSFFGGKLVSVLSRGHPEIFEKNAVEGSRCTESDGIGDTRDALIG